jgi:plastocyanin
VLLPLSIPVIALGFIAVMVLNISRVLIAIEESNSKGLATLLACVVSGAVLGGCVYMASREAERRQHRLAGPMAFLGLVILASGIWGFWAIEVRADAEKAHEEAEAGAELGEPQVLIHAFDLGFKEKTASASPGDVIFEYVNEGTLAHTLVIEKISGGLEVGAKGATDKGVFKIAAPGDYVYFCDVAGHRAAGMEGVLTVAEGAGGGAAGGGGAEVTVGNALTFEPKEIDLPAGPAKITLKATGSLAHTLVVDGVAAFKKLEVAKTGDSQSGTLEVEPGEYTFYCDVPGHRAGGMEGKIKVGGA